MEAEEAAERVLGRHIDGDVDSLARSRADESLGRNSVGVFVAIDADREERENRFRC